MQFDQQEKENRALIKPLTRTNSPPQALLLKPADQNPSGGNSMGTGSGVALFHSNSIPFLSQALHLAFVNTVHTTRGVYPLTRGIPS